MEPEVTTLRLRLKANGYSPIPVNGKIPHYTGWQTWGDRTEADIRKWPFNEYIAGHSNTGLLTRDNPFLDLDLYHPEAIEEIIEMLCDRYGDNVMVRTGMPPKRGVLFQLAGEPFPKYRIDLIPPGEPDGRKHGIELLSDGQQFVGFGIHPDTHKNYIWNGGSPDQVSRNDLPGLSKESGHALVDACAAIALKHGYHLAGTRKSDGNGFDRDVYGFDWSGIFNDQLDHDALVPTAMAMLRAGMHDGAVFNLLHACIVNTKPADPQRQARRLHELPSIIKSARTKLGEPPPEAQAKPGTGYPFHTADEATDISKSWVIKGVLAREEVSSFIGPPGASKSALLTDIGVYAAAHPEWRGRWVKEPVGVIYFALERGLLVRRRLEGYRRRGDLPEKTPFAVVSRVINLLDQRCVVDIYDTIKAVEDRVGVGVALCIFDTYSKGIAAGGGEENSARDQNIVAANMRRVLEKAQVHISGIGHTGKDETRGERGSNAHLADVDMQARIGGTEIVRNVEVIKANDQDLGTITTYALERIELGTDSDGDPIHTFILNDHILPEFAAAKLGRPPKQALVAFSSLQLCIAEIGVQKTTRGNGVKNTTTLGRWKDYFQRRSVVKTEDTKTFDRAFTRQADRLQADGFIGIWGEDVWIEKE